VFLVFRRLGHRNSLSVLGIRNTLSSRISPIRSC
jgi:hypothetical protein